MSNQFAQKFKLPGSQVNRFAAHRDDALFEIKVQTPARDRCAKRELVRVLAQPQSLAPDGEAWRSGWPLIGSAVR